MTQRICQLSLLLLFLFATCCDTKNDQNKTTQRFAGPLTLVVHGGAGVIKRGSLAPEKEGQYHETIKAALDRGYKILEDGGKSTEAVIEVVKFLEDSPLFNAGKGAVFTHEGTHELDASIMEGKTLRAGAVAGVTNVKNPILLAEKIMTASTHVMLSGKGAEMFAEEMGLELVEQEYFFDSARYDSWKKTQEAEKIGQMQKDSKFGTVGCVALDRYGDLAAATSTGGMSDKKYGRIGDSPIIGAGTYANNATCAISATGWGEYFIRLAVAHDISALMEYGGLDLNAAAKKVIHEKLAKLGGDGGVIGLTHTGEITMTFNSEGMYRGYRRAGEKAKTFIYKD